MADDLVYNGNAAAPAAAATIVQSAALPGGRYLVLVSLHLEGSGTPAAADLDNVGLYSDATLVATLAVPEAKSVMFFTPDWIRITVADTKKLTLKAIGNATASVTYAATMVVRQEARF